MHAINNKNYKHST